jgi:integrase/recombinase XerD
MLVTYRRHNPLRCKHMSRSDYRCKCPIWVSGTDSKGKRRREALKLRDWTKAQELVRRWDVEGSQPKPGRRATLSEWKDSFLNDAETSRHLNAETIRKYKLLFKQLEAFAQIKKIRFAEDIGLEELTEFRATWQDAALSASKKLERLRSIYKFAVARKWVENNFAAELKTPKTSFVPTQPFSDDEMKRILESARRSRRFGAEASYAFILMMRYSGLRISDVTVMARHAVNGNRLRLHTAKTGEPVSMKLPVVVVEALKIVQSKNPKYFFWSGESRTPAAVSLWRKRLADVFRDAGIHDAHSHRFRDTFAVSLLQAGVSLENVSTLLGHRNFKVTQRHYSPWVKSRQDALDRDMEGAAGF